MSLPTTSRPPSGRGRAVLATDWWPGALPADVEISLHTLVAHDGEVSKGTLYRPGTGSSTVLSLMHPRQDLQRHPLVPQLLDAGYAVWTQNSREAGNDLRLVHETALLDVAAGLEFLRDRGFDRVGLIGHSGGAGLYAFYTAQAQTDPEARIGRTPGGAPVPLREAELPVPDALVLVAPHPGQGQLLLNMIDPSVADESDPFSTVPDLDPFNPANGFAEAPESSSYSTEFTTRYRKEQRERVARIDERARSLIAEQLAARKRWKAGSGEVDDRRRSVLTPVITTYRTDADLRCTDLSIDPSDRPYGSVISAQPSISNYGVNGFGRLTTPEAWLSTWSGLSSNAGLVDSLATVTVPSLLVEFTGDTSVFPTDVLAAKQALAATDSAHVRVRADHFGRPLTDGERSGIEQTVETLRPWLSQRGLA